MVVVSFVLEEAGYWEGKDKYDVYGLFTVDASIFLL